MKVQNLTNGGVAMIQLIAGAKGQGKTKKLIQMANDSIKQTDGRVVFIDKNNRHMYTLHYDIRLVEMKNLVLENYREFMGCLYGILAMDNDIKEIYVDGLAHIIKDIPNDGMVKLFAKLKELNEQLGVNFVASMNCNPDELPAEVKEYLVH